MEGDRDPLFSGSRILAHLNMAATREVVEEGFNRPGATEIRKSRDSGWFSVIEPANTALVHLLKQEFHADEAESIVLALETKPDILLLDETEARRIAAVLYNITVIGIIGLLMQAKNVGQVATLIA